MQSALNYTLKGTGIPFLCQHGLGSNLNQTLDLLNELPNIQLVSADCPGHHESKLPAKKLPSFNYYVDELNDLLNHLNAPKAIFGGISMGAGISLNFALRYPEKVKALVLIRPAWLDKGSPENLQILLEAAKLIGQANGKQNFQKRADYQLIKEKLPLAARSILGVFGTNQRTEIPTVLEHIIKDKPFNQLEALQSIHQPCLIIGNNDDPLHPFDMAVTLRQHLQNSQLVKVTSRYVNNRQYKRMVQTVIQQFLLKNNLY